MNGTTATHPSQPARKPFKQVRYQGNDDSYEDREDLLLYNRPPHIYRQPPPPSIPQAQPQPQTHATDQPPQTQTRYILKSKSSSADKDMTMTNNNPLPSPALAQPVKGIPLPIGPAYDPQDEEDLRREMTYQQELKSRVDSLQHTTEATVIPHIGSAENDSDPLTEEESGAAQYPFNQHHHSLSTYNNGHGQRTALNMYAGAHSWEETDYRQAQGRYSNPQVEYANQQGVYANQHGRYANQQRGYANQQYKYTSEQGRYANQQGGYENQLSGYANQQEGSTNQQSEYTNQQGGYSGHLGGYSTARGYAAATGANRDYSGQEGYRAQGYTGHEGYTAQGYPGPSFARIQPGYGESYDRDRYEETDYPGISTNPTDNFEQDGLQEHCGPHGPTIRSSLGYVEPHDGCYLTEPQGYTDSQKPAPVYNQSFTGGEGGGEEGGVLQAPMDEERYQMDEDVPQEPISGQVSTVITLPSRPDYDYVSHNKVDYGFTPKRTYKKIGEVKKREEERLQNIFVHPTVRPQAKKGSRDNSPKRLDNSPLGRPPVTITYNPTGKEVGGLQGAEVMWDQRSAFLTQSINSKLSPIHTHFPSPREVIQPGITQHIVMEDGQRISVDVNLRLVSPSLGSEGEEFLDQMHFRQTGRQYPMIQHGGRTPRNGVHSDNHNYWDPVYTSSVSINPYKKISPIGSRSDGLPSSGPVQSDGSYLLTYLRDKEKEIISQDKPWYRVYNLHDYRRMQKEVQLGRGTLGPDLANDTFREKHDKMLRKLEYAKSVKDKNTKELMNKTSPSPPAAQQEDILSKRKLAMEYSKNVPKPTVRPKPTPHNSYELASKLSHIAKPQGKGQQPADGQHKQASRSSVEVVNFDKMTKRHQENKHSAQFYEQKV